MGRISRTVTLARVSWQVLSRDRELLLLPVLSFLVSVTALALLWIPLLATVDTPGLDADQGEADPVLLIAGVASILLLSVVGVFFKGALVAGAHERLSGGDPTVRSALSRAMARIGGLLPWALLAGTVGLVLSALKDRAGRAGRFRRLHGGAHKDGFVPWFRFKDQKLSIFRGPPDFSYAERLHHLCK